LAARLGIGMLGRSPVKYRAVPVRVKWKSVEKQKEKRMAKMKKANAQAHRRGQFRDSQLGPVSKSAIGCVPFRDRLRA
jgi:hypothetical protein